MSAAGARSFGVGRTTTPRQTPLPSVAAFVCFVGPDNAGGTLVPRWARSLAIAKGAQRRPVDSAVGGNNETGNGGFRLPCGYF
jgi:hypothetical protein